jgi:hypothetical protein
MPLNGVKSNQNNLNSSEQFNKSKYMSLLYQLKQKDLEINRMRTEHGAEIDKVVSEAEMCIQSVNGCLCYDIDFAL